MLEIRAVDLVALAEALEDHTAEHTWWFDPSTGQLELGVDGVSPQLDTDELIPVDPLPASVIRRDIQEFLDGVQDGEALARLGRAAEAGELAFAEAVGTFPQLRLRWREFVDERRQRRAVQWLADEGVVPAAQVDRELAERRARAAGVDTRPSCDPETVAAEAAGALFGLYGSRLRQVVPLGGQAARSPDVDLLVVLDRLDSVWTELARMEPVMWRLGGGVGAVVTALAVAEDDLRSFRPARAAVGPDWDGLASGCGHADVAEELAAAHALSAAGLPRPAIAHALAAAALAAARALTAGADDAAAPRPRPRALGRGGVPAPGDARRVPAPTPAGEAWSAAALVAALVAGGPAARHQTGGRTAAARLLRSLAERARAAAQPGSSVPRGEAARALADAEDVVRTLGWPTRSARREAAPGRSA